MNLLLITSFTLGLLGSLHCIAMCGPVAMALPIRAQGVARLPGILIYNSGRSLSYALLGAIGGMIGSGFTFFGLQQTLSVLMGVIILLVVIVPRVPFFNFKSLSGKIYQKYRSLFTSLLSSHNNTALLGIGLLNGLLPCGLVYIALAGSAATGNILNSSLMMAAFGLGTVPVMFSISLAGQFIGIDLRNRMKKAVPVIMSVMALMMVLRGMNLGIPYLSPSVNKETGAASCCEQKSFKQNNIINCHP